MTGRERYNFGENPIGGAHRNFSSLHTWTRQRVLQSSRSFRPKQSKTRKKYTLLVSSTTLFTNSFTFYSCVRRRSTPLRPGQMDALLGLKVLDEVLGSSRLRYFRSTSGSRPGRVRGRRCVHRLLELSRPLRRPQEGGRSVPE